MQRTELLHSLRRTAAMLREGADAAAVLPVSNKNADAAKLVQSSLRTLYTEMADSVAEAADIIEGLN